MLSPSFNSFREKCLSSSVLFGGAVVAGDSCSDDIDDDLI